MPQRTRTTSSLERLAGGIAPGWRAKSVHRQGVGCDQGWIGMEALEPRTLLSTSVIPSEVVLSSDPVADVVAESAAPVLSPAGAVTVVPAQPRAIWIWRETLALVNSSSEPFSQRDTAIHFLQQKGITTVYLYAAEVFHGGQSLGNPLVDQPDAYAGLVADLHARGIAVHALLDAVGSDAARPDSPLKDQFQAVLDYNQSRSRQDDRFDGFNLDLEPWVGQDGGPNPAWDTLATRLELSRGYLELASELMRMRQQQDPGLVVGGVIPFWFDVYNDSDFLVDWNGTVQRMNQHVQETYDTVTIQDYRDYALTDPDTGRTDGIVALAQDEIDYATQIGKAQSVVIGVETRPASLDRITFFEETEAVMNRELGTVAGTYGSLAAFAGFAIHDFGNYADWANPLPPRPADVDPDLLLETIVDAVWPWGEVPSPNPDVPRDDLVTDSQTDFKAKDDHGSDGTAPESSKIASDAIGPDHLDQQSQSSARRSRVSYVNTMTGRRRRTCIRGSVSGGMGSMDLLPANNSTFFLREL